MSRDSQRGTFLSRTVLMSSKKIGTREKKDDHQMLLSAFGITPDGNIKQNKE